MYHNEEEQNAGGVNWGGLVGGIAAIGAISTLGVGVFGPQIAKAIGENSAVGQMVLKAHGKIGDVASTVANKFKGSDVAADIASTNAHLPKTPKGGPARG
jgi:hypothetical protein